MDSDYGALGSDVGCKCLSYLVDLVRFELTTSSMPWKRAPNCATGPLDIFNEYNILTLDVDTRRARLPTIGKMPFKGSAAASSLYLCLCALLVANSTSCWVRRRNITR